MIKFFNYPGSKEWLVKKFFYLLKREKKVFADVFCGSGIVGLNLLPYYDKIILNDLDPYIYNFFKVLKEDNQGLYNYLVKNYAYDKKLFKDIADRIIQNEPITNPLKSAADYLFFRNFSFRALKTNTPCFAEKNKKTFAKNVELIKKLNKKILRKIEVFNFDGYKFFADIKNERDFFIFLDPPYFVLKQKKINNFYFLRDLNIDELLNLILYNKSEFLLTIDYIKDFIEAIKLNNLNFILYERRSSYNFKVYIEMLIFNYAYAEQYKLFF